MSASTRAARSAPQCAHCGQALAEPKLCAQCRVAAYCGKDCQTAAWPAHKQGCKAAKKPQTDVEIMCADASYAGANVAALVDGLLFLHRDVAVDVPLAVFICHVRSNMAARLESHVCFPCGAQKAFLLDMPAARNRKDAAQRAGQRALRPATRRAARLALDGVLRGRHLPAARHDEPVYAQ